MVVIVKARGSHLRGVSAEEPAVVWKGEEHSQVVCPPGVDYLGGRPNGGRMGAIAATWCLRGPDHIAGTASTAAATA